MASGPARKKDVDSRSYCNGFVQCVLKICQSPSSDKCQNNARTGSHVTSSEVKAQTPKKEVLLRSKFIIGEKLGEGSFGVVYFCSCRTTEKAFAVKMVDKVESALEEIDKEVELLMRLDHKNIVKFHEVFYEPCFVCIVTDVYRGGDVIAGIERHWKHNRRPFSAQECLNSISQMTAAVDHLHSEWIVHRDIKCDNYLASEQPLTNSSCRIVLTDFGTAVALRNKDDRLHDVVGSTLYWSPEMARKDYGIKVDVFALGVSLFGMVTGTFPFKKSDHLMDPHFKPKMESIKSVSLSEYLTRALDKTEATRASVAELKQSSLLTGGTTEDRTAVAAADGSVSVMHEREEVNEGVVARRREIFEDLYVKDGVAEKEDLKGKRVWDKQFCFPDRSRPCVVNHYEWVASEAVNHYEWVACTLLEALNLQNQDIQEPGQPVNGVSTTEAGDEFVGGDDSDSPHRRQSDVRSKSSVASSVSDGTSSRVLAEQLKKQDQDNSTAREASTTSASSATLKSTGSGIQGKMNRRIRMGKSFKKEKEAEQESGTTPAVSSVAASDEQRRSLRSSAIFPSSGFEEVDRMLRVHGIKPELFGIGQAKTMTELVREVQEGTTVLMLDATRHRKLVRVVDTVLLCIQPPGSDRLLLREVSEQYSDGRVRELKRCPGTKKNPHENTRQAALRGLQAFLDIPLDSIGFSFENAAPVFDEGESPSYPGLLTVYRKETVIVRIGSVSKEVARSIGVGDESGSPFSSWSVKDKANSIKSFDWVPVGSSASSSLHQLQSGCTTSLAHLVMPPIGLEVNELRVYLEKHGVDTAQFGTGEAKSLKLLSSELIRGEWTLRTNREGSLIRVVDIVYAWLENTTTHNVIVHKSRQIENGEHERLDQLPHIVRRADETQYAAVKRLAQKELSIEELDCEIQTPEMASRTETSTSPLYPGLVTSTRMVFIKCVVLPSCGESTWGRRKDPNRRVSEPYVSITSRQSEKFKDMARTQTVFDTY